MGEFIDLTGKIFNRITVIDFDKTDGKHTYWNCKCLCGNIKSISGQSLLRGRTQSCGCLNREMSTLKNTIDLTGNVYGRLTVLGKANIIRRGVGHVIFWHCKCICGNEKDISGNSLKRGSTISCGCYNREKISERVLIDLTGQVFGKLTVLNRAEIPEHCSTGTYWLCQCFCGNKIITSSTSLKGRHRRDCGCIKKVIKSRDYKLEYGESSFNDLYRRYKNDANSRGIVFEITKDDLKILTKQNCFYCGIKPSQIVNTNYSHGEYIYNGIDRIDNTEKYSLDNLVTCCKTCNFAKRNMSVDEFLCWIDRVHEHQHSQKRFHDHV